MNTCGTCRYFGEEVKSHDEDFNYFPSGYHQCDLVKHGNENTDRLDPGHNALVVDFSGAYAALIVESDFGCVKWEAR